MRWPLVSLSLLELPWGKTRLYYESDSLKLGIWFQNQQDFLELFIYKNSHKGRANRPLDLSLLHYKKSEPSSWALRARLVNNPLDTMKDPVVALQFIDFTRNTYHWVKLEQKKLVIDRDFTALMFSEQSANTKKIK